MAGTLAAQPWPARPLRLIVPLAAGGTGDTLARDVARAMEPVLGVPITVENRAGANGILGMEVVAKAPADGYTLVMGGVGPVAINPSLYPKLPFNVERDFTAIVQVADTTSVLVVPAALPVKTLKDLIALAKKRPGELFYSSSGSGSTPHLNAALFATMAGIDIQHVPYKGSTPGRTALLGGEVSLMVDGLLPSLPFIQSGRFRALGITSAARSSAALQIPTIAETLAGYQADIWYGLLGPAGTPREVVDRLNAAANKALASAELREAHRARNPEVGEGGQGHRRAYRLNRHPRRMPGLHTADRAGTSGRAPAAATLGLPAALPPAGGVERRLAPLADGSNSWRLQGVKAIDCAWIAS